MRLFVAVWPSADALENLDESMFDVRRDKSRAAPRWVDSSRMHVTLVFLGELSETYLAPLEAELADAMSQQSAFESRLRGTGQFGERVLWIGLDDTDNQWKELARTARRAVRSAGANIPAREWRGHLTVAYGRSGVVLARFAGALTDYSGPAFDVAEASLVRSSLGANPTYEVLSRFALAGDA